MSGEDNVASVSILDVLTDDAVIGVLSFLKPREMGRASITCTKLRNIFGRGSQWLSEVTKFDIKWAKYAGKCLEPKVLFRSNDVSPPTVDNDDEKLVLDHLTFHVLPDGHWVSAEQLSQKRRNKLHYYLKIHSIDLSRVIQIVENDAIVVDFASNQSMLVTMAFDVYPTLQCWRWDKENLLTKVASVTIDGDVSSFILSPREEIVYYEYNSSIKIWRPMEEEEKEAESAETGLSMTANSDNDDVLVDASETSSYVTDLLCWGDYFIFGDSTMVQIWSTVNRRLIRCIKRPDETYNVSDLRAQNINGKEVLISVHKKGHFHVFSLEEDDFGMFLFSHRGNFVKRPGYSFTTFAFHSLPTSIQSNGGNNNKKNEFRFLSIEPKRLSNKAACLKVWLLKSIDNDKYLTTTLLEQIDFDHDKTLLDLSFLPDGRLLTQNADSMIQLW